MIFVHWTSVVRDHLCGVGLLVEHFCWKKSHCVFVPQILEMQARIEQRASVKLGV